MTHRALFNFGGTLGNATWELVNTATYIDGSTTGPTFARPDDIPAIGGIPLRDRRAAFIFRNGFRLTEPVGKWFFRPVATAYIHDFKTEQLYQTPAQKTLFSYENYVDRQDVSGGLDVGYEVVKKTYLVAGFRYGRQDQYTLPGAGGTTLHSPYDNGYQRILAGVEGSPVSWLKLAVLAGPDIRQFDSGTPAGFDPNRNIGLLGCLGDGAANRERHGDTQIHALRATGILQLQHVPGHQDRPVMAAQVQRPVHHGTWIHTLHRRLASTGEPG